MDLGKQQQKKRRKFNLNGFLNAFALFLSISETSLLKKKIIVFLTLFGICNRQNGSCNKEKHVCQSATEFVKIRAERVLNKSYKFFYIYTHMLDHASGFM